jgi:hypothetical protein
LATGGRRERGQQPDRGDVDLMPLLRDLIAGGYRGAFSVEYEGEYDRTLDSLQPCSRGA